MVLSLFYLQNSTHCEVLRGRAGLGNYVLKDEFSFASLQPDDMKFPHKTIPPDKILDTVKNQIRLLSAEFSNSELLDDLGISTSSDCAEENQPNRPDTYTQNEQDTTVLDNITIDKDTASKNGSTKRFESQEDPAEKVVKAGGVKFVEELKVYMVEGVRGRKYSVTIDLKEDCHCPSTATCYHRGHLRISRTWTAEMEMDNLSRDYLMCDN